MLDLTAPRYVKVGTNLGGAPPIDTRDRLQQITEAMKTGDVIDGYAFPTQPPTDKRFGWIAALHQDALIPDILTRTPGMSQKIRAEGAQDIPEELRDLFPATFNLTTKFPPTALLHGDADVLVEYNQSARIAERLGALGVNVLLENAAGQGHGFDVRGVPTAIDVDSHSVEDAEFYNSFRIVIGFLDSVVAKANE
jgi:acetyl esterase/lipase